jgi:hypothetical protein
MIPDHGWLAALRRYLLVSLIGNGLWEIAHVPLYTIWQDGTLHDQLVAVAHCTAGDFLIALSAWAGAIVLAGHSSWPTAAFQRVAVIVIVIGLAYTGFSEWMNTAVRRSWTYSEWMPLIPGLGIGLSPVLQWLVVPSVALWAAGRTPAEKPLPRPPDGLL